MEATAIRDAGPSVWRNNNASPSIESSPAALLAMPLIAPRHASSIRAAGVRAVIANGVVRGVMCSPLQGYEQSTVHSLPERAKAKAILVDESILLVAAGVCKVPERIRISLAARV